MAEILPVAELAKKQFEKKKKEYLDQGKALTENEEAALFAQCLAVNTLKAPASAKLPDLDESHVSVLEGGGYRVSGYVDSQNSYGAYVRTQYSYRVVKLGSSWETSEVFVDAEQAETEKTQRKAEWNAVAWWILGIISTIIIITVSTCQTSMLF